MCNQLWLKDIKSVWWLECEIKKWNDKEINTHSFDSHSQQNINKLLIILIKFNILYLLREKTNSNCGHNYCHNFFFPSQSCVYDHI
jgi:hypothetical protein